MYAIKRCEWCGNEFEIPKKCYAHRRFCSIECSNKSRTGKGNPKLKGRKMPEEQKIKISKASKGNHYALGYKHSEETRKKLSEMRKGHKFPPEFGKRISEARQGKPHPHKGRVYSDEDRKKMSLARKGKPDVRWNEDQRKRISEHVKKQWQDPKFRAVMVGDNNPMKRPEVRNKVSGQNCHLWRGGISFKPYCPAFTRKLKEEIREEHGRHCYLCGKHETSCRRKLSIHHCDYNKGQGCGQRWNLVPLCNKCHAKTSYHRHYYFNLLANHWAIKYTLREWSSFSYPHVGPTY